MSLKKTICKKSPNITRSKNKILNTNEATHSRVSLLADLFDVNKSQVLNNIVHTFFIENEEEIKDRIAIKRNQLDQMF